MNRIIYVLFALMASFTCMASVELPEPIASLQELAGDETALIDAARRYHRQQIQLNDWDIETARDYAGDDINKMHEMTLERIQLRHGTIKVSWDYVLSLYPKNIVALNFMGEYWYDIGNNQAAALIHWKQALALNSDFTLPLNNLGLHYFHTGDYRKGFQHLARALALEEENSDYLFNMAQMYLVHFPYLMEHRNLDKPAIYAQAMKYSKAAVRYAPNELALQQDYATNFYAAENFGVKVDWAEAAQAWQDTHALASHKEDRFFARLNEGRCWIQAGKKPEALVALEAAWVLDPTSKVTKNLLLRTRQAPDRPAANKGRFNQKAGSRRTR